MLAHLKNSVSLAKSSSSSPSVEMTTTTPAQAAHAVLQLQDTGKPVYKVDKSLVDDNLGIRETLIIFKESNMSSGEKCLPERPLRTVQRPGQPYERAGGSVIITS